MTEPVLPPAADASATTDVLVLPAGLRRPRPETGDGLAALVRDLLVHWGADSEAVRAVSVDAEVAGADIVRLRLSASGIPLPSLGDPPELPLPPGELDEVAGRLEEFTLVGERLRWEAATVDAAAEAHDVAFRWLLQDGRLVGVRIDSEASGGRASLRLETDLQPVVESIRLMLNRQLGRNGVQVRELAARASELDGQSYRISGEAAARWKVLPFSARLSLVATIDDDLVLRFSEVKVSSRNPLCAAVFLFARNQIREAFAEPVPLCDPRGPQLTDLTLRFDPRLLVEATFADLR